MLKEINKCTEKENGHKHRGFYSECRDADESTECTWRAKLRVTEDKKAPRVIRWGQKALVIFRPQLHLLPQQLEAQEISNIVVFMEACPSRHNETDSDLAASFSFSVWSHKVLLVFCKQYCWAMALI